MPYRINGTGIPLEPEEARWMPQTVLGVDGNGRAIYPPTREFEMRWGLMSNSQYWQFQSWWQSIGATGTVTADLPKYASAAYEFQMYTGVVMRQLESHQFFTQYYTDVVLLLTNITTDAI